MAKEFVLTKEIPGNLVEIFSSVTIVIGISPSVTGLSEIVKIPFLFKGLKRIRGMPEDNTFLLV